MADSTIPVAYSTREKVKRAKRGGETYDTLLRKMLAQYDPDPDGDAVETAAGTDGCRRRRRGGPRDMQRDRPDRDSCVR